MTKIHILISLVGPLVLAAVNATAQVTVPPDAHQWEVHNASGVSYGTDYELYNQKNKSQIGYENKKFGSDVDLGWVGHSGGHFNFMRKAPDGVRDHRTGPIPENADVAIYNTKSGRYLKYKQFGNTQAELELSKMPAYEWQLHDQKGTSLASFALFNNRVKRYLVLQNKDVGINLGWFNDNPSQSFSVALSAQQVIEGPIPFLGSFPALAGANRGALLTVQNASQSVTLLFVKPGKSTRDCYTDLNATVVVAPRATMTSDQMKTLYGSAMPRLPINFLACISAPTTPSISLTFVNITYKLDP